MTVSRNPGAFLITCVLGLTVAIWTDASGAENSGSDLKLELSSGLLTLESRDVPLLEVLNEIGELAGFKTIRLADQTEVPLINLSFTRLPLQQGVERIVDKANSIIFFSQDESQQRAISQIWLLGSGESSGNIEVGSEPQSTAKTDYLQTNNAKSRSEAVLRLSLQKDKGPILQDLTRMLQLDPDPLVRVRAAIAIGAFRDEGSVVALEAALLDEHSSVRLQAITALGQIGSERAVTALGSILLDSNRGQLARVVAAQALWKQGSQVALGYLRIGAQDTDEQVRLASSKAPSPVTAQDSFRRFNSEELE